MKRTRCLIVVLLAGLLTVTPALGEPIPFPATIGAPYTGRMTVEAFPVDGGDRMHRAWGDAEVRFSAAGDDRVLFSTTAALADGGSLDLSVTVVPDGDGVWRSLSHTGPTEITAAGRVLSLTEMEGFHMVLTGQIGPENGKLTLRRIPTENAGSAPDAEMLTVFLFDVSLPPPGPVSDPEKDDGREPPSAAEGRGACERIEWRLVNRWTWGGGMSLSREPQCVSRKSTGD
ncbi:hypothetical protein [Paracoccus jeotgali]|uniref:Uncharacterized protein n=1 Tax=Paracoccus jeotgali TaxID=2065379 RepID=A0A2K9MJW6_9RHOB|nr:hypothetical protein [Paracoccus jeotgali]AUM75782.1 hypothetical protein CYR75_15245 [Paracoccus jeotgali]